ncbi:MAG: PAS domain-containing protein, partial [Anaerolineae bacterium]|nr:PAS domain-containing protein [Anaerolineae bacterium]
MRNRLQVVLSWLQALWRTLTEANPTVQDARLRRQSQLLSSLLLTMILVGLPIALLPLLLGPVDVWSKTQAVNGLIEVGMVFVFYRLSRRGHYRLVVLLLAILGTISILGAAVVMGGEASLHVLYYLAVTIVFVSAFLPAEVMLALLAGQVIAMLAFGGLHPSVELRDVVLGPLIFNISLAALTMLIVRYRERLDAGQQADLVQSEERYRIISEMISDYAFAFRVEPDGTFTREWLTDSFTRIMGYDKDEVMNDANLRFYHPEDQPAVETHLKAVLAGEERNDDYRLIHKDGSVRWFRLSRRPVWDASEQRVVRLYGVAKDITDEKFAQDQKFAVALAQARFDLVHRFFRAVSHDFRTSLSIIETNRYLVNQLILRKEYGSVPVRLAHISEQVVRLTKQLENLRVASSLNSPLMEPCDLNVLAREEAEMQREAIQKKGLHLQMHADPTVPVVQANMDELRHAISHLIENAIHFTLADGSIDVRVYYEDGAARLD